MANCGSWPIGVCSWSLGNDVNVVWDSMCKMNINHVHLAIGPALEENGSAYFDNVRQKNWIINSTMIGFAQEDYSTLDSIKVTGGIVPDDCWERNRQLFTGAVEKTHALGVKYLSMHAGFIDESDSISFRKFTDRIRCLADAAADKEITLLLETGQEDAQELSDFLCHLDHSAVAVNFDPANMILYDKNDPVTAVGILGRWIRQVHIKDALRTDKPGTWGSEVPWSQGQVGNENFLQSLKEIGFEGVLAIEREAGDTRFEDIKSAVDILTQFD